MTKTSRTVSIVDMAAEDMISHFEGEPRRADWAVDWLRHYWWAAMMLDQQELFDGVDDFITAVIFSKFPNLAR